MKEIINVDGLVPFKYFVWCLAFCAGCLITTVTIGFSLGAYTTQQSHAVTSLQEWRGNFEATRSSDHKTNEDKLQSLTTQVGGLSSAVSSLNGKMDTMLLLLPKALIK